MEYRNPASTEHKIIPAAEACCCGGCPDDCSDMGNTRTVTFTGFTDRYAALNDVPLTLTRFYCEWYVNGALFNDCWEGYNVTLFCDDDAGGWILQIELSSWGVPGSGSCNDVCTDLYQSVGRRGNEPPLGAYSMEHAFGSACDEATVTATLGKP